MTPRRSARSELRVIGTFGDAAECANAKANLEEKSNQEARKRGVSMSGLTIPLNLLTLVSLPTIPRLKVK